MPKKLYKDRGNQVLMGVCAGLAEYLNVDPTIVRILWVLFSLMGGSGILIYIVCTLIIPDKPR